jgi:hypothetical protein
LVWLSALIPVLNAFLFLHERDDFAEVIHRRLPKGGFVSTTS